MDDLECFLDHLHNNMIAVTNIAELSVSQDLHFYFSHLLQPTMKLGSGFLTERGHQDIKAFVLDLFSYSSA